MNVSSQFVNLNKCCCFPIHFEIVTTVDVTQLINLCSSYNCFRLQSNHSWCNFSLYLLNHSWWVLWRRSQRGGDLCYVQDSQISECSEFRIVDTLLTAGRLRCTLRPAVAKLKFSCLWCILYLISIFCFVKIMATWHCQYSDYVGITLPFFLDLSIICP